jgi:clan AA aspartic protease (TIGR02281 family)
MMRLLNNVVLLLVGSVFGWWLHAQLAPQTSSYLPSPDPVATHKAVPPVTPTQHPKLQDYSEQKIDDANTVPDRHSFRQLLDAHQFEQAVDMYEQSLLLSEAHQLPLKQELLAYLEDCLRLCANGVFIQLVDTWLASYYEDTEILLMLAKYQHLQGYPEQAASALQMAMTYAYFPMQRERVTRATQQLVSATDEHLGKQQRWVELLGFYELLDTIELSQPAFRFRQAMIYQQLGETGRSRSLLLALRNSDDQQDPQWTQALDGALAAAIPSTPNLHSGSTVVVPMTRRGSNYLVDVRLNGQENVTLMIDTGASITTLTTAGFSRLRRANFDHKDTRLFNTANGVTRGDVYRASSIAIGNTHIDSINVAVLDYEAAQGIDGLLGMNVLRNYHFEIDQDKSQLNLRPRSGAQQR